MLKKALICLGGVVAVLTVGVLIVHATRPRVVIDGPAADTPRVGLEQIDHGSFDVLLQKYVDEQGMVAYRRWKAERADVSALDQYLAYLGAVDLQIEAARSAQLAYWINAYNALTIKGILREYPTSTIRNHTTLIGGYNLWTDLLLPVDGREYS